MGFCAGLLVLVPAASAAPGAPSGGTASLSDTHPDPGQVVTVRAADLLAGTPAVIDYVPDSVRFGVFTVSADGTVVQEVRIPATTYDGAKQIIVTSRDSKGHFARIKLDLTINGPPANVKLQDDSVSADQELRFTGTRWFVGSPFVAVLYPEKVVVAQTTIGGDQRLAVSGHLPSPVRNGKHGLIVAGRSAGGKAAFFKMFVTVTGGLGSLPDGDVFANAVNPLDPTTPLTVDTPVSSTSTTRVVSVPSADDVDTGGVSIGTIILVVLAVLLLVAVGATWLASSDGRAWRAKQRERRKQRRRHRSPGH
jgi:hypothetical protein